MENLSFYFSNINPFKLSFSFTWDDNFSRHIELVAPTFKDYNIRCTFYVNPGEPNFPARLSKGYAKLAKENFELGSHGHTHHHFSKLTSLNYIDQLVQSQKALKLLTGILPFTFAFPHHDFDTNMLMEAKKIYLETRNTLNNTKRISLKSDTHINSVIKEIDLAILNKYSLVFSGHSISLPTDLKSPDGYEPISLSLLDKIIQHVIDKKEFVDITTFEQAVLKDYIMNNCIYSYNKFSLKPNQVLYLKRYGITINRLKKLI